MVIWEFGVYSRHSGQRRGADGPCSVDGSTSLLMRTWRSGSGLFLRCCRIRVAILYAWAASEDFGVSLLFMLILVSCLWSNVTVCMGELAAFLELMPGHIPHLNLCHSMCVKLGEDSIPYANESPFNTQEIVRLMKLQKIDLIPVRQCRQAPLQVV